MVLLYSQCHGCNESPKIIGGRRAAPGQFPHQISLTYHSSHICGGSIVSATHVVTAAHCVEDLSAAHLGVVSGAQRSSGDGQRHRIKSIRIHPGYTGKASDGWKNDIAVITLTAPISFNVFQKPIALASRDYATGTYRGIISGWGKTSVTSGTSPHLLWASVNVLSQNDCLAAHPNRHHGSAFTNPKHICTLERRGVGACQGDSGGPLVVDNELVGVISWVAPCALGVPDVHTNIFHYQNFILQSEI
ncbi:hypothetical protein ONE63_003515 [Megalurothrips usitatus]|uniref:Peptidase S1 domain-containing protein n=1 Tax=Megalurothrips usitatus TaxID=439358 RepID=A0AAV7XA59_9NEOP|nr:hypothetical protein ONE63_003515 [Megalurothrips usitatus]